MLAVNETDDLRPSVEITNAERYRNFTVFSATLARKFDDRGNLRIQAFFDIRDALEMSVESLEKDLPQNSLLSANQVKAIDIEVAALWVVHGGESILTLRNEHFGGDCERGFATETDLWSGEPGFSEERWQLWEGELRQAALSEDDQRRRELALKAAAMIVNR